MATTRPVRASEQQAVRGDEGNKAKERTAADNRIITHIVHHNSLTLHQLLTLKIHIHIMGNNFSIGDFACLAAASVAAVQLLTPANPVGSSLRLLKQLRSQVGARIGGGIYVL